MNRDEQKYQKDIDVERMWIASKQMGYIFYSTLPMTAILLYMLWGSQPHPRLLCWIIVLTVIYLLRWLSLHFYKSNKQAIGANLRRTKWVLFTGSLVAGIWWGIMCVWFLEPSNPINLLIIAIFIMYQSLGAVVSWFCYIPAVAALLLPAVGSLSMLLVLDGTQENIIWGLIFAAMLAIGLIHSVKLSRLFDQALILNFENVALRQESEEKSQLLEKALANAEQANAAKTRFLASASHDLRQPIHALGLFFAELSDRVNSPETALVLGQIDDSISAINSMLNALLDISKLDAQIVMPSIESVELAELFTRLQSEFQPIATESNNALFMRMSSIKVNTDPGMLERMLRNLIGNALRYTQNGRVLVAARSRGQQVEIQVFDTGKGIPADQLDEIFIEFHQLHNPERDRRQGLGLGLAIVKRLATLLQHDIKVTSNVGRGSCFSISLPLAEEKGDTKPEQESEIVALPNYSLAGHQVLILDDDMAVLTGMERLLVRWECDVISASSPNEALEKITAYKPKLDLLIVDYRLPDNVSGIDVAEELQYHLDFPVAVLIITGDTGPERLREAKASGYPLLHKPVQPAKLRSTLQYLFSKGNPKLIDPNRFHE